MVQRILIRTDKNGTKYYHCTDRCFKCGGTGMIEYYRHVNGGECFDCNGSGIVEWEEKEYTPEYEQKLQAQREKREARKLAKQREKSAEINAEFYQKQGFNPEGKTYFVLGNTYDIKEELKAQGAKWDNLSRHWHMPTQPEGHECLEVSVEEMYFANVAGVYDWRNWIGFYEAGENGMVHYANKIQEAEQHKKAQESTSQHVGEIGEKITVEVTYIHSSSWEHDYGYGYWTTNITNLHTFKDAQGNVFIWKTGNGIEEDYGTKFILKGTVKDHSEYNGVKQTVLTRCKLQNSLEA